MALRGPAKGDARAFRTEGSRPTGSRLRAAPRRRPQPGGIRALASSHRSSRCPRWSLLWSSRAARMQARDARFRADRRSDAGRGDRRTGGWRRRGRAQQDRAGGRARRCAPACSRRLPRRTGSAVARAARAESASTARAPSQPCSPLRSIRGWRAWCGSRQGATGAAASTSGRGWSPPRPIWSAHLGGRRHHQRWREGLGLVVHTDAERNLAVVHVPRAGRPALLSDDSRGARANGRRARAARARSGAHDHRNAAAGASGGSAGGARRSSSTSRARRPRAALQCSSTIAPSD